MISDEIAMELDMALGNLSYQIHKSTRRDAVELEPNMDYEHDLNMVIGLLKEDESNISKELQKEVERHTFENTYEYACRVYQLAFKELE